MNRSETKPHKIIDINPKTATSFILRIEKNDLEFKAGQHINVGTDDNELNREYSIYSSENDPYIEVLIKEVKNGLVSPKLAQLKKGNIVLIEFPSGYFTLPDDVTEKSSLLFIATGTGIAPFHSYVKSNPTLNYHLLHGITDKTEECDIDSYPQKNITICTSRQNKGNYHGRVTSWLQSNAVDHFDYIFLCGNRNMINDAYKILSEKEYPYSRIKAEAYF